MAAMQHPQTSILFTQKILFKVCFSGIQDQRLSIGVLPVPFPDKIRVEIEWCVVEIHFIYCQLPQGAVFLWDKAESYPGNQEGHRRRGQTVQKLRKKHLFCYIPARSYWSYAQLVPLQPRDIQKIHSHSTKLLQSKVPLYEKHQQPHQVLFFLS